MLCCVCKEKEATVHLTQIQGDKMQKVELRPEHHRGGLLGMAAPLTLTSHTFRTSPTQRGKYVLEVIFGLDEEDSDLWCLLP